MSNIYKLSIKPISGMLSKIHSDTTFGHFCWRLKEEKGEDSLTSFLDQYRKGNPVFTVSNAFYERENELFFTKPLKPPFNNHLETKKEKIKAFLDYKKSKQNKYFTLSQLNCFLNGENIDYSSEGKVQPKSESTIRTSVRINRETLSSEEGKLFSYNSLYLDDKSNFCVFIKVIDEKKFIEFDCENIIKEIFRVGYGKKKSSGYGQFEIISYSLFEGFKEPVNADGFITLSNYLPAKSDNIDKYYYDYFVKFGKLGENFSSDENPFKFPLVLLTDGSVFYTKSDKEYYGRVTGPGDIHYNKNILQNGYAFSLKFKE